MKLSNAYADALETFITLCHFMILDCCYALSSDASALYNFSHLDLSRITTQGLKVQCLPYQTDVHLRFQEDKCMSICF